MKPSFGSGGGDIDIGFFSKVSFINDVTIKMDFGRPPPLYISMSYFWCPPAHRHPPSVTFCHYFFKV